MNRMKLVLLNMLIIAAFINCEEKDKDSKISGIYCLNIQNMEMTIVQDDTLVSFYLQQDLLINGSGYISNNILYLTAQTSTGETFTSSLELSENGSEFSGPYIVEDSYGTITLEGTLKGVKGECVKYDIDKNGVPKFVVKDYTQLSKIKEISKFRSGFGHSFTDGSEECRSMKHYYTPYEEYRDNNIVEIYSPVKGKIISVVNDGHGASPGIKNKQIQIIPDDQPAFTIVIFHTDLLSAEIKDGKIVQAGEQLGYARLYYEDLDEHASSFDIAIWGNTPSGMRLVSYFETMQDVVFSEYTSRGAVSREEFIITKEQRDADALECSGETFLSPGNLENFVQLN